MWHYRISTGELTHDGEFIGTGYSGSGPYRNDPASVAIHNLGPIPAGDWRLSPSYDDPHRGKNCFRLSPDPGTNVFGRSGFLIHGDNITHTASEGCIILGPSIRQEIAATFDRDLKVIT